MLCLIMLVSGIICFLLGIYFLYRSYDNCKDRDFFIGGLLLIVGLVLWLLAIAFYPHNPSEDKGGVVFVPIIIPYK